jgi:hypothetical protein
MTDIFAYGALRLAMCRRAISRSGLRPTQPGSDSAQGIDPKQFEDLARLMIETDPQAAIRAFGAAMRHIEIQKQEADASETVAA